MQHLHSRKAPSQLQNFSLRDAKLHLAISGLLSYDMDNLGRTYAVSQSSAMPFQLLPDAVFLNKQFCFRQKQIFTTERRLMYTYTWYQWLTFFYLYCFFGWIFESTYVSLKQRHFVNRGFLRIPMLPLYGSGAVMMLWVSLPFRSSLILTYISGVIGATALEYVTGYVMEQLFKVRYWDYGNQPFNVHGYICLTSSIAWGFLTIFMTHVIHKPIERAVLAMPLMWNLFFVFFVTVIFIYDSIVCTKEALAFGKSLEAMKKSVQSSITFRYRLLS